MQCQWCKWVFFFFLICVFLFSFLGTLSLGLVCKILNKDQLDRTYRTEGIFSFHGGVLLLLPFSILLCFCGFYSWHGGIDFDYSYQSGCTNWSNYFAFDRRRSHEERIEKLSDENKSVLFSC